MAKVQRSLAGQSWAVSAPIALGAATFLLALGCIFLTREVGRDAAVWPVNAMVVALLLRAPSAVWLRYGTAALIGNIAANLAYGDPLYTALPLALCNGLEVALSVGLLRRVMGEDIDLSRGRDLATFALLAGVLAPLASSILAGSLLAFMGHGRLLPLTAEWFVPDSLDMLIVTPALLALNPAEILTLRASRNRVKVVRGALALAVSLAGVFGQSQYPLLFLVLPALLLIAFELGTAGAAVALLITSCVAMGATLAGSGPAALIHGGLAARLGIIQLLLVTITLVILPLTAVLAQRRRLDEALRRALADAERARAGAVEAEDLSRLASQLANIGNWRRDLATGRSVWSDQMFAIHGVSRHAFEARLEAAIELYHPDDQPRVRAIVAEAAQSGAPFDLKVRLFRADNGEERIVVFKGQAECGADGRPVALFGVMRDITEEETARQRVEASEARFRLLADSTTDVVLTIDRRDVIQYVSPSAMRYGYDPEAMVGMSGFSLVHPDDLPKLQAIITELFTGGQVDPARDRTYRIRTASGGYVWMEGNPAIIRDPAGQPISVISQLRDVTERHIAGLALAESEARYRLLTENATDVIACYGVDGLFTFLSPALLSVLGYEPHELLGRSPAVFMHPEDFKPVMRLFSQFIALGQTAGAIKFEYRAYRKDGELIWLEAHPKATYNPVTGKFVEFQDVVRDITARKRVETALGESEFRYRVIADNATDIISRMGVDGRVAYFSPSVVDVTGHAMEDLLGASLLSYLHPEDVEPALEAYRGLIEGTRANSATLSYRVRHRDGHWIWLEGNPTLVRDSEGAPMEIIDVRRDVSARVAIERDLRATRDAAEAAAAVKSDFMANMSHEIRTPLTAIIGFTSLLAGRPELNEGALGQVRRIAGAGQALLSIVNDILDFSALEAGHVDITPRAVDPALVLGDALMMFSPQAGAKGLALALEGADALPPGLMIDADKVRQILVNLIGNAIKFTESGSVTLRVGHDASQEILSLEVEDTGAGLDQAQQDRLFQRFSQVDASSTRRHGGTGLGLAISKGLAEAMGGRIGVRSVLGQGSVFHLTIHARQADLPAPVAFVDNAVDLDGLRVLVVDDNPVNRELASAILTGLGVDVTEAADGAQAVEAAALTPFDVILMDIRMPVLDGPAAAARIRAEAGPNQDIPILAFTADFDLDRFNTGTSDFDGGVSKPIVPIELVRALIGALSGQSSPILDEEVRDAVLQ